MRWVRHLHGWVIGMACLGAWPLYADGQYKITGVDNADSLNIRAEPGAKASVVAKVPHDGSGITLQEDFKWIGKTHWVKIAWKEHVGWVSKAYLQPMEASADKAEDATADAKKTDDAKADDVKVDVKKTDDAKADDTKAEATKTDDAKADDKTDAAKSSAETLTATSTQDKTTTSQTESSADEAVSTTKATESEVTDEADKSPSKPAKSVRKEKISGMWILECGNMSPFWKVEVLPEWISGTLGEHKTGMPITHKKQEHGKYRNIALKTEVKGANQWNRLELTLTYNKSCPSTLAQRRVAFNVTGSFNGEPIAGCCRALQVE